MSARQFSPPDALAEAAAAAAALPQRDVHAGGNGQTMMATGAHDLSLDAK